MKTNLQVETKTQQLESKMIDMLAKEKEIQEKFGFSGHAVEGMSFTKGLKIGGYPSMVAAFGHPSFHAPQTLAEIVSLVASAAQEKGMMDKTYDMPFGVMVNGEQVPLRIQVIPYTREDFIAHVDKYGIGIYPDPRTHCYIVKVADILNYLPGEKGYIDFGQEGKTLDVDALKQRWAEESRESKADKASKFDLREALSLPPKS